MAYDDKVRKIQNLDRLYVKAQKSGEAQDLHEYMTALAKYVIGKRRIPKAIFYTGSGNPLDGWDDIDDHKMMECGDNYGDRR